MGGDLETKRGPWEVGCGSRWHPKKREKFSKGSKTRGCKFKGALVMGNLVAVCEWTGVRWDPDKLQLIRKTGRKQGGKAQGIDNHSDSPSDSSNSGVQDPTQSTPSPLAESKKASHNISDQWFRQSFGQPFRFSISGVRDSPQSTPLVESKKASYNTSDQWF